AAVLAPAAFFGTTFFDVAFLALAFLLDPPELFFTAIVVPPPLGDSRLHVARCLFLGVDQLDVVHPLAVEGVAVPEPGELLGGTLGLIARVLGPPDAGGLAEDPGGYEGADVEADAVVEVGVPADRLLGEGLPPHEDVVWGLARQDQLELVLQ